MFGCYGLYLGGEFFGILDGGDLYFRTDGETRAKYEQLGSGPFQPNERQTLKNYLEVPPDVVDDRGRLMSGRPRSAAAGRSLELDALSCRRARSASAASVSTSS